jgi:hypothetical protein
MTPLEAMKRLYRVAVVKGVPWRDATPGSARLSPAALQLLDGMLAADPGRRASLQQVLDSEWVNQDLPPKLQVRRVCGGCFVSRGAVARRARC